MVRSVAVVVGVVVMVLPTAEGRVGAAAALIGRSCSAYSTDACMAVSVADAALVCPPLNFPLTRARTVA